MFYKWFCVQEMTECGSWPQTTWFGVSNNQQLWEQLQSHSAQCPLSLTLFSVWLLSDFCTDLISPTQIFSWCIIFCVWICVSPFFFFFWCACRHHQSSREGIPFSLFLDLIQPRVWNKPGGSGCSMWPCDHPECSPASSLQYTSLSWAYRNLHRC